MWVQTYKLDKKQGTTCEHCGTYIVNVFVIHFDDGFTLRCGSTCIGKLLKKTNITEYGTKLFGKMVKSIQHYEESIEKWKRWQTPEEAEAEGCFQRIEDPENHLTWRIRTQEEFNEHREWMITELLPKRIENTQEEMQKKFENVRIKTA